VTYSAQEFLDDWQEHWGPMDLKWAPLFLSNESLKSILGFDRRLVLIAITKSRKLKLIAEYLEKTSYRKNVIEVKPNPSNRIADKEMQQAIKAGYLNNKFDPKIPDTDWWRDQD
jgi:hypothetical protein